MPKPDKTSTLLVEHLRSKEPSTVRDNLISRAQCMIYDDFGSPMATPKIQLHADLIEAGFDDLARNVVDGFYD